MKVTVMQGQSLVDIAMQVYGSAEGVFTLAKENGLSVTDEVSPGQVLTYEWKSQYPTIMTPMASVPLPPS